MSPRREASCTSAAPPSWSDSAAPRQTPAYSPAASPSSGSAATPRRVGNPNHMSRVRRLNWTPMPSPSRRTLILRLERAGCLDITHQHITHSVSTKPCRQTRDVIGLRRGRSNSTATLAPESLAAWIDIPQLRASETEARRVISSIRRRPNPTLNASKRYIPSVNEHVRPGWATTPLLPNCGESFGLVGIILSLLLLPPQLDSLVVLSAWAAQPQDKWARGASAKIAL